MSYEAHVTMLIHCLSACAYALMVLLVAESCTFMMLASAKSSPPTSLYPLLWNVWFGLVTFVIFKETLGLLKFILYADASKAPISKSVIVTQDGAQVSICDYESSIDLAALLYTLKSSTKGYEPNKRPSTPDSERSKAETEIKVRVFHFISLRAACRTPFSGPLGEAVCVEAVRPCASCGFGPGLTICARFQTDGAHGVSWFVRRVQMSDGEGAVLSDERVDDVMRGQRHQM